MALGCLLFGWRAESRRIREGAQILIATRSDGAVAISQNNGPSAELATPSADRIPIFFLFRTQGAAELVMTGALRRLSQERRDEQNRWYLDLSVGQAAAAIKAEAKGLCFSFEVVHPHLKDAPIIGPGRRNWVRPSWARPLAVVCYHAVIIAASASIGLAAGLMAKGS